ncbi:hypothetical protein [Magnetospirillum sp. LM-5]|uniref:hypothetical protein n=1 Tax=Magnetospirillum sp. LM-5 TaxID=2681466 RepID=UPI00156EC050|nr:hypothetical protein [Magnetospirillum sp. LM-5]
MSVRAVIIRCLVVLSVLAALPASPAGAQTREPTREEVNADWLKTIPDYEMRLYERVTAIKNRQVGIQRTLVAGFAATGIALAILVVMVARLRRSRTTMIASEGYPGQSAGSRVTLIDRLEVAHLQWRTDAIARRQHRLVTILERLEAVAGERGPDFDAVVAAARAEIEDLRREAVAEPSDHVAAT